MNRDLLVPCALLPNISAVGLKVWVESTRPDPSTRGLRVDDGVAFFGPMGPIHLGNGLPRTGRVFLRLDDSSTRDRILRWMAAEVGFVAVPTQSVGAPGWNRQQGGWVLTYFKGPRRGAAGIFFASWASNSRPLDHWTIVPRLEGLDAEDDSRLPDESCRVDAVALGRVATHLPTAIRPGSGPDPSWLSFVG